ncbi:MAG: tRNA uridine-5-carboxymethylaminomethyl(34) synthesis GTPase MnmE [Desulforhopalus sp.]|nr:tRNA uridine-5-carboxymethylaminomethyl(34) synthesis GTPase MnmE [Desulforhopalus sp.]
MVAVKVAGTAAAVKTEPMTPSQTDTIAAIATPPGAGGIGIIRISGERALPVLREIFVSASSAAPFSESHKLYYGHIREEGRLLDEVLAVFMAAPHSYTAEDVAEIQCHGSSLVLENVLEAVLRHEVRLAEPGEFTRRAFLNGRIDLTRAEAVVELLTARTKKGVDLAEEQLSGALYKALEPIRQSLLHARAYVEVAIDFPEEDVEIIDHGTLLKQLGDEVKTPLGRLLGRAGQGRIYREGISMVIAGLPNVGKSSLLNALLNEERALVAAIPGTTRDSIEEIVDIGGVPVRIVDTAGIHESAEEVEEMGILRAKRLLNQADLVLFVVDASCGLRPGDLALYDTVRQKPLLMVVNKSDLVSALPDLSSLPGLRGSVAISAKQQQGLEELRDLIYAEITGGKDMWEEAACTPNLRHKASLESAVAACDRIMETLAAGLTYDLIAVDLQDCLGALGDIVGETTTEDVLDVVFAEFCLGK